MQHIWRKSTGNKIFAGIFAILASLLVTPLSAPTAAAQGVSEWCSTEQMVGTVKSVVCVAVDTSLPDTANRAYVRAAYQNLDTVPHRVSVSKSGIVQGQYFPAGQCIGVLLQPNQALRCPGDTLFRASPSGASIQGAGNFQVDGTGRTIMTPVESIP